ncbi:hypothetical protein ACLOJK_039264 [Asimina triloba]
MRRSKISSPSDRGIGNPNPLALAGEKEGDTARSSPLLPHMKKTPPNFAILTGSDQQQPGGAVEDGDDKNTSEPIVTADRSIVRSNASEEEASD